jgi:hypothetical protein
MSSNSFSIGGIIAKEPASYLISGRICARGKLQINEKSAHLQLADIVAQDEAAEYLLQCSVGDRVMLQGHLTVHKKTHRLQICADNIWADGAMPKAIPCTHHMQIPQVSR